MASGTRKLRASGAGSVIVSIGTVENQFKKMSVTSDCTPREIIYLFAEKIDLHAPEYFDLCETTKDGLGEHIYSALRAISLESYNSYVCRSMAGIR